MNVFMNVVKQLRDLVGARGRIRFEIDLAKWEPGRAKQSQPKDVWVVTFFEDDGAAEHVQEGPEAIDALVSIVARVMTLRKKKQ